MTVLETPAKRVYAGYFAAGALVVFCVLGFFVLLLHEGRARAEAAKANQIQQAASEARVMLAFCLELENIKTQRREEARESFKNLDRTLRVLEISKTSEIVALAKASLAEKLELNRKRACPYRRVASSAVSVPDDAHDRHAGFHAGQ